MKVYGSNKILHKSLGVVCGVGLVIIVGGYYNHLLFARRVGFCGLLECVLCCRCCGVREIIDCLVERDPFHVWSLVKFHVSPLGFDFEDFL